MSLISHPRFEGAVPDSTIPGAGRMEGGLTPKVVYASATASLCSMAFGYDVGVVSGSLNDMADTVKRRTDDLNH